MARLSADNEVLRLESFVRGYHISKRIWTPRIGEHLAMQYEENDPSDSSLAGRLSQGESLVKFLYIPLSYTACSVGVAVLSGC